ncbi:hypothetical protein FRC20_005125 [Serendipita sp. 405]|nr:hypothetical protein FRC15_005972 [Serendipita sp. 397]KAG8771299.1 hypothetical protein FRC16_005958 [Serendipita sp. 398]KAG8825158.1 hypothetical protein FRC18_010375 [Serendipita sp. 400]KAG8841242.1 hypothetical protein FRC20_005125 [Serendipita sp. 405]
MKTANFRISWLILFVISFAALFQVATAAPPKLPSYKEAMQGPKITILKMDEGRAVSLKKTDPQYPKIEAWINRQVGMRRHVTSAQAFVFSGDVELNMIVQGTVRVPTIFVRLSCLTNPADCMPGEK